MIGKLFMSYLKKEGIIKERMTNTLSLIDVFLQKSNRFALQNGCFLLRIY